MVVAFYIEVFLSRELFFADLIFRWLCFHKKWMNKKVVHSCGALMGPAKHLETKIFREFVTMNQRSPGNQKSWLREFFEFLFSTKKLVTFFERWIPQPKKTPLFFPLRQFSQSCGWPFCGFTRCCGRPTSCRCNQGLEKQIQINFKVGIPYKLLSKKYFCSQKFC